MRAGIRWYVAFLAVFLACGVAGEILGTVSPLPAWFTTLMLALNIAVGGTIVFTLLAVFAKQRQDALTDWLYTYLRTFYRDPKATTGWNNVVFPNVAMPHALWTLQGENGLDEKTHKLTQRSKGSQSATEYDATVRDLVNFLVYASEPAAADRKTLGIAVLLALGVLFIFAYLLKKEFWKDVK